jgi:hypothetical protein
MLTIRDQQLLVLENLPRYEFETQVMRHLQRFYPREYWLAGDDQMRRFVGAGVDRAAHYGFSSRRAATLYVTLMVMLGSEFDEDPQIPWAKSELQEGDSSDPGSLIEALFDRSVDYLGQIAGEDNGRIARAMIRLRKHDFHAPVCLPGESLDDAIWALSVRLYPEKAECQGKEATTTLIRQAISGAESFGIKGENGLALYCLLAFMVGSGFHSDPMYWWAGQILGDSPVAPEVKFDRLLVRSLQYLEDSLRD